MKKFGRVEDITEKEYYTNSFHYDVRKHPTPFDKISFEEAFPKYAAGGFIHYCEYPNLRQKPQALEAVWDWAYDHVGYLGTNTSIDKCFKCVFSGDFQATAKGFACPQCGNHDPQLCDVVKRIRQEFGHTKNIWSWTGYTWDELMKETDDKLELLSLIDILVDGWFLEEKDLTLQFRGSANQRIIDVPKPLASDEVVIWDKLVH